MYTELTKTKVFGQLTLAVAPPACWRHGRQKVLIPECDLTGRRSTITLLPVRSYSGINTFCLPWRQHAGDPPPTVSSSKTFLPENETTVSLKTSFVVIMLLHEDLTQIQPQIKPCFLFGESFTLRSQMTAVITNYWMSPGYTSPVQIGLEKILIYFSLVVWSASMLSRPKNVSIFGIFLLSSLTSKPQLNKLFLKPCSQGTSITWGLQVI